ncbi:MAG: hypothetical protein ACOCXJ_06320 [Planctomycetota bacterium]
MRRVLVADCPDGAILARPVHGLDGVVVAAPGAPVDAARRSLLQEHDIQHVLVVAAEEALPDPTIPVYMDRYAEDFAPRLHARFHDSLGHPAMQELFLAALAHAGECYRRYRMDSAHDDDAEAGR